MALARLIDDNRRCHYDEVTLRSIL